MCGFYWFHCYWTCLASWGLQGLWATDLQIGGKWGRMYDSQLFKSIVSLLSIDCINIS